MWVVSQHLCGMLIVKQFDHDTTALYCHNFFNLHCFNNTHLSLELDRMKQSVNSAKSTTCSLVIAMTVGYLPVCMLHSLHKC